MVEAQRGISHPICISLFLSSSVITSDTMRSTSLDFSRINGGSGLPHRYRPSLDNGSDLKQNLDEVVVICGSSSSSEEGHKAITIPCNAYHELQGYNIPNTLISLGNGV